METPQEREYQYQWWRGLKPTYEGWKPTFIFSRVERLLPFEAYL